MVASTIRTICHTLVYCGVIYIVPTFVAFVVFYSVNSVVFFKLCINVFDFFFGANVVNEFRIPSPLTEARGIYRISCTFNVAPTEIQVIVAGNVGRGGGIDEKISKYCFVLRFFVSKYSVLYGK